MSLLHASSLTRSFAGVHALSDLSFELRRGEVHALVGENGAGKTTFVRIVTGAETADGGSLAIDGRGVVFRTPAEARAQGIAAIYQQPALFPDLSVAENITLPVERGAPWSHVSWRRRYDDSRALLERLGASLDPARLVETLSLPEQQLVEIAKAVGADARILLMDEPTSALTTREVDRLFAVIDRLRGTGAGVIYISHRLEEIRRVADRVTVIRDGRTVRSDLDPRTPHDELIRLMVGRDIEPAPSRAHELAGGQAGELALEVRGLSASASGLADISFAVRRGEVLGIAGLVGSGRTELAETLFGLRPRDGGEVRIGGMAAPLRSPAQAIRAGVAYVPEDRRRHGVIAEFDVAANTSLASLDRLATAGFVRRQAERDLAADYVRRFNIRTPSVRSAVGNLSGGNQQKVALARWLATRPSVLILDEPTQGVDVGAKAEIHRLIRKLAAEGLAVIVISSDLSEILLLADQVLVMRRGRTAGMVGRADATTESVMSLALGAAAAEPSGAGAR
jgi:rhamnose transport system ATP-binding protein